MECNHRSLVLVNKQQFIEENTPPVEVHYLARCVECGTDLVVELCHASGWEMMESNNSYRFDRREWHLHVRGTVEEVRQSWKKRGWRKTIH